MPSDLRTDRTIAQCLAGSLTEVCAGRDPQPGLARWVSQCFDADRWGWGRIASRSAQIDLHVCSRPGLRDGPEDLARTGLLVLSWLRWASTVRPGPWQPVPETAWRSTEGWERFSRALGGPAAGSENEVAHVIWFARAAALSEDESASLRRLSAPVVALVHLHELLRDGAPGEDRGPSGEDEQLSARERQVLGLLAQGLPAKAIATRLTVSVRTVHCHLQHIYGKLGAHDRLSAVLRAQQSGLLPDPSPAGR